MQKITVITCGQSERLRSITSQIPALQDAKWIASSALREEDLRGARLLFSLAVDALGESEALCRMLRDLRGQQDCLEGSVGAVIIDGETELDTKQIARRLIFAANLAGCAFPGKPLVEATGSLKNLEVLRRKQKLPDLLSAYRYAASLLVERLGAYVPQRTARPRLLVLHASDRTTSNTLALGEMITERLAADFAIETVSLRNGTIHDCRGCSYKVCAHYAAQGDCFYGGAMAEEVLPAVLRCDGMLLLCPNYNDAVGANIMAFINRLTGLTVSNALAGKMLYAVAVSGYSGGDLVAQQLLGALCLNKAFQLPPRFCLIKTANDPGEIAKMSGIQDQAAAFAAQIRTRMLLGDSMENTAVES